MNTINLTGHAYDWTVKDCYTDDNHVEIQAWCLDRDSKPFLMRIQDYPATCYIELPTHIGRRNKIWRKSDAKLVYDYISYVTRENPPIGFIFKQMRKLYYYRASVGNDGVYTPKKYPMMMMMFPNLKSMWACKRLLETPRDIRHIGRCAFKIWECDISIHRKLLTTMALSYCQWFNAKATPVSEDYRISKTPEYLIRYGDICPIDPEQTESWKTSPRVFAYDIETYSSNHNAFPSAYYALDVAYIITVVFQIAGIPETRKRYAIVFGDTKPSNRAEIIKVNSELELLEEFQNLITRLDPEIITGYNILGFDNMYLDARLKRRMHEWKSIGRVPSYKCDVKKLSWESSGYGSKEMYNFDVAGRINVDLYQMITREYKFSTYGLDVVAKHFLGRGKNDVPAKEMFRIFALYQAAVKIYDASLSQKYLGDILESLDQEKGWKIGYILSKSLLEANVINKVFHTAEKLHPLDFPTSGSIQKFWCEARNKTLPETDRYMDPFYENIWDCFIRSIKSLKPGESLKDLYIAWLGSSSYLEALNEMTKVVEYGIEDAELVMDLFEKIGVWTTLVETSNVCGVTISDLYTRGQQIRGISLVYDLSVKMGIVLDRRTADYIKMGGGYVGKPNPGLYDYVICVDFTSLYPTIIMAHNICWTTIVPPELMDIIPDHMCNIIEWDEAEAIEAGLVVDKQLDDYNINSGEPGTRNFKFKFVKAEIQMGILPVLVGGLVNERSRVREKIKETNDQVIKGVLNSRQAALKVTANSCYGILSAQKTGKLSLVEGGMSITAVGRQSILLANSVLEDKYGAKIVYGDTDSTMFTLPNCNSGIDCVIEGPKIADELTKLYPPPMKFEFEKAMRILCICPKKYAAFLYATEDIEDKKTGKVIWKTGDLITDKQNIFVRGIILARRDNCQWQRGSYRDILWRILMFQSMEQCLTVIIDTCLSLATRNVDLLDLVLVRGLGSNYKSDSYFLKVFSDEIMKIGKPAQAGDRLEYVVVDPSIGYGWDGETKLLLGHKMRLISTYLERQNSDNPEPISVEYYIENLLKNSVEQIFYIGYKDKLDKLSDKYKGIMLDKVENHKIYLENNTKYSRSRIDREVKSFRASLKRKLSTNISGSPISMMLDIMREKKKYINFINSMVKAEDIPKLYPAELEICSVIPKG